MKFWECFENKHRIIFSAGAAILVLAAVVLVLCLLQNKQNPIEAALNSKAYAMVQVLVTSKVTDNNPPEEQGLETQQPETAHSTTARLKKDGDVIFESDVRGDCYYFPENGENCVLYLEMGNGMSETGVWTRALRSEVGAKPSVDFEAVSRLTPDDLVQEGDRYVPGPDSVKKTIQAFTGWSDSVFEKYTDISLSISLDKNRFKEVLFSFKNPENYLEYEFCYAFSYEEVPVTLPNPGETGVLQSLSEQ